MVQYKGRCHCGDVQVIFETEIPAEDIVVQTCGCSFCQRTRPIYTSDAGGLITVRYTPDALNPYRFGHETASFLSCKRCGNYIIAVMGEGDEARGVLNVAGCLMEKLASKPATPMDFDQEDDATRTARRKKSWTPVRFEIRGTPA